MHPLVYRGVSHPGICVLLRDRVVERQPRAPRRGDVVLSAGSNCPVHLADKPWLKILLADLL